MVSIDFAYSYPPPPKKKTYVLESVFYLINKDSKRLLFFLSTLYRISTFFFFWSNKLRIRKRNLKMSNHSQYRVLYSFKSVVLIMFLRSLSSQVFTESYNRCILNIKGNQYNSSTGKTLFNTVYVS